ncbi:MAG: glycosyltransferase family 2 protein [Acidobacteriota bacterium]|nr:glycosyltransferase family 2 protein [Acidobacteriota bacterium]
MTGPDRPPVTAVVVAYGDPAPLVACLGALPPGLPVIVVDNSSSAETRQVVEEWGARYVDAGRNVGFAAGVNLGLRALDQPGDILLLNPDAVIDGAAVDRLRDRLAADARLACVAPAQVDDDGRPARVAWPFPSPLGTWLEAGGLGRFRKRPDFLIGSILLIRAEALSDVGPFDERFFLYSEETDWQMRARRRGWKVELVDDVVARHSGAGTGGDPWIRQVRFYASEEMLIRKHYGAAGWRLHRVGATSGALIRGILLSGDRRLIAKRRATIYLKGPTRLQAAVDAGGSNLRSIC